MSDDLIVSGQEAGQIEQGLTALAMDSSNQNIDQDSIKQAITLIAQGEDKMFEVFKLAYQLWNTMTKDDVAAQVAKSAITADQYKTIVGENYQAPATSTAPVGASTVASDSTAATSGTANVTHTVQAFLFTVKGCDVMKFIRSDHKLKQHYRKNQFWWSKVGSENK